MEKCMLSIEHKDKLTALSIPENAEFPVTHFNKVPLFEFKNLLSELECQELIRHFSKHKKYSVGVQGINDDNGVGSKRVSCFDKKLAKFLNDKLVNRIISETNHELNSLYYVHSHSKVNCDYTHWKYLHVSPFFRYMVYNKEGQHYTHYDAPYVVSNEILTLFTGLIYLTTNDSCSTVFIDDEQSNIPIKERNMSDWTKPYTENQVICESLPEIGKVILFEHQQAHAVSKLLKNEDRIVIRFDVFFKAV